jgi:hypothetical protein
MALVPESEMLKYVITRVRCSGTDMSSMGTKIIAVRVGPEPHHADFTIHEDLVRKSSLFFQAALSHEWRESQERIVKLPACHIAAFKLYTQWLYTGRLYALPAGPNASLQESSNLVRGFFIGDYVQDVNFQDSIIDALIEWNRKTGVTQREGILNAWVRTVLQKTSRFGPLHKLLVDVTVWDASHTWWVSEAANFPIEFVQDVAIGLSMRCKAGGVSSSLRAGLSHCKYHSHGDKPCYRAEQPG